MEFKHKQGTKQYSALTSLTRQVAKTEAEAEHLTASLVYEACVLKFDNCDRESFARLVEDDRRTQIVNEDDVCEAKQSDHAVLPSLTVKTGTVRKYLRKLTKTYNKHLSEFECDTVTTLSLIHI